MSQKPNFLILTFPAQGHINPALQFAKRLVRSTGVRVTLATSISAHRHITTNGSIPDGLSLVSFSDGFDDGVKNRNDAELMMLEFERRGSECLTNLIVEKEKEDGRSFTCVIYTLLLPWVAEVARGLNLPSALLWIQPATVFDIYYYYFNGYGDMIKSCAFDKESSTSSESIILPGAPSLSLPDLPSFLIQSTDLSSAVVKVFEKQMDTLRDETNPVILVNTFDALESDALNSIEGFQMMGIGPLIPSAFLDGNDPSDTSFGADMFQSPEKETYTAWLDSKPDNSVVYVSFGSISVLSKQQQEELARGLLDCERPFLWVVRETKSNGDEEEGNKMILSCRDELEQHGLIVPWCSQVEVLSHRSVGCFLTHCGWNSSLESLVCGVPVVAFPQWTDQGTNAKLIEDVWKIGVRVTTTATTKTMATAINEEGDDNGLVSSEEIKRCLEKVMGIQGEELRKNAEKWKVLAKEATREGGSSRKNLKAFVEDMELYRN